MNIAIFPGSFDPFTLGHLDVLNSALGLFDKVIIAVGYNHLKRGYFTPDERIEIIKDSLPKGLNVEVVSYTGLTVNLCKTYNAKYIIRGLRTTTDFELESVISQANKKISPEIQTIFIPASQECSFISSTVVRDVIINQGDASIFMANNLNLTKYLIDK